MVTGADIKIGIIGAGAIAQEHLRALKAVKGIGVAAISDISPARARYLSDKYGIATHYQSYADMLAGERIEWVHITTPPETHYDISLDCLRAGKNVLCEKPIVPSIGAWLSLQEVAREKGVWLLENQNLRCHSSIAAINRLLKSGAMGEVVDVQIALTQKLYAPGSAYTDQSVPHFTSRMKGGPIADFLPHLSYLVLVFAGEAKVIGKSWTKRQGNSPLPYDEFRALIEGAKCSASIGFSGNGQPDGFWVRIIGTNMSLDANLFDAPRMQIRRHRRLPPPLPALTNGFSESWAVAKGTIASTYRKLAGHSTYDGLAEFFELLYGDVKSGRPPSVSAKEIEESVRLVESLLPEEAAP